LSVNWNSELMGVLDEIYTRLYGWLWLVYVISLTTSVLPGNTYEWFQLAANLDIINQAVDKGVDW
jgi:hypothetical protein